MYPTKFSPHSSQRLVKLERWTAIALAKKRPHPLTRTTKEKRATSHEYIFYDDLFRVSTVANRTRKNRTLALYPDSCSDPGMSCAFFCSMSNAQMILCER